MRRVIGDDELVPAGRQVVAARPDIGLVDLREERLVVDRNDQIGLDELVLQLGRHVDEVDLVHAGQRLVENLLAGFDALDEDELEIEAVFLLEALLFEVDDLAFPRRGEGHRRLLLGQLDDLIERLADLLFGLGK